MHTSTLRSSRRRIGPRGQRGALTLFSAVLILILLTLMLLYASRVGLLESRISGNDVRQKVAFHAAEGAIDQDIMYLLQNSKVILSSATDAFWDGTGFTRDGWFAAGNQHWVQCTAALVAEPDHPCGGDVPAPVGSYYYDDPATADASVIDSLPVDTTDFPAGSTARVSAIMCFITLSDPTGGCNGAPATEDEAINASLVLTLLGYGYSDCTDTTDVSTCTGEATVAMPISNFKKLSGTPAVPLVTKSTFPPNGTAEVVGNPNGGGVGVPLTSWVNDNPDCPPETPITSSGSWQTCEYQEWYHTDSYPTGVACTDNNCQCGSGGNDTSDFLSWRKASDTNIDIDIIQDTDFPCDLFEYYFKVPRALYQTIKNTATVISDCTQLGPGSSGFYWATGSDCTINSGVQVGSVNAPIILVSAATTTKINGGAEIFGVLYVFDGEDPAAVLETLGSATVYGAVIVDASLDKIQGTFQIVHAGGVLAEAKGIAGVGTVNGGWRDFGLPDIAW